MKEFVEKLTKISSANTENKLDDKMERYSKWIADQEIDGTTFCAKILTNEDSFIRWAAPELVKGPATVLYNALAEFLKGTGINPVESGGGQGVGAEEHRLQVNDFDLKLSSLDKRMTEQERDSRRPFFGKSLYLPDFCQGDAWESSHRLHLKTH